jgi:hypothetical protein
MLKVYMTKQKIVSKEIIDITSSYAEDKDNSFIVVVRFFFGGEG